MKVRISFFAHSREIVGASRIDFEIREEESVSTLLGRLQSQFPDLLGMYIRVAVNTEYVEDGQRLYDGDEVAIIPPVSGG